MKLIISNVSGIPIYEQIKQQIKAAILSGELQAEETLPSLRTPVSYTHLDVYKRQGPAYRWPWSFSFSTSCSTSIFSTRSTFVFAVKSSRISSRERRYSA